MHWDLGRGQFFKNQFRSGIGHSEWGFDPFSKNLGSVKGTGTDPVKSPGLEKYLIRQQRGKLCNL